MPRSSIRLLIVSLAILTAIAGLLSNVIASDLWERIKPHSWYSLPAAVLVLGAFTAATIYLLFRQQEGEKAGAAARQEPVSARTRATLLDKIEQQRVRERLEQGLRKAVRVDLKLTEAAAAVARQLSVYTIGESEPPRERRTDDDVGRIFEASQGSLLILGDPGTGKTNLLLELTATLIAKARQDPEEPIPVVFSLSRWTLGDKPRSLAEWLISDLADVAQYGLSRATAEALVRGKGITPLLDGLDEVAAGRRTECVEAIHAYQREGDLVRLAVCCRNAEYGTLPKLKLRTAVRVEKLTREEVNRYLSLDRLRPVARGLGNDPELLEVIDTPLWLHVALLASEVAASAEMRALPPRDRLYARFVRYALRRKPDTTPGRRTPESDFLRWTSWLTRQMKLRNQTQFALEQLKFDQLFPDRTARLLRMFILAGAYGLAVGVATGTAGGVVVGVVVGVFAGVLAGVVIGVVVGITRRAGETFDEPIEEIYFDWRKGIAGLVVGLVIGLVVGLFVGLVGGLFVGLVGGLEATIQRKPVAAKSRPNYGTARSVRYFMIVLTAGCALEACAALVLRGDLRYSEMMLFGGGTVALSMSKGGLFAVRHYAVRLLLWHKNSAPLRYVRFLDEAVDRLFLVRNGGSYEFFHSTFRDYLAKLPTPLP